MERGRTHSHRHAMESLLDMVAQRTGKDPIELRLDLLNSNDLKQERMANVLKISRSRSGWKKGNKRGFAAHYSYKTFVAVVADVSAGLCRELLHDSSTVQSGASQSGPIGPIGNYIN